MSVRLSPFARSLLALLTVSGVAAALLVVQSRAEPVDATPTLQISTLESGLSFPWDLTFTPDNTMLFTERPGRLWARPPAGPRRQLTADLSDVFVGSESGLLGIVVDPAFASNRRFYTCQAYRGTGTSPIDIRVIRWTVDTGYTRATRVGSPVVSGLPITSGRHGGCRLRFAPDGTLHVGTGDAATGTNPQNLQSLGGKTLRVNPDGSIPTDNPFYSRGGNARYVYTYGHRNVQGLAVRPGTNEMWTVEHGSDRDDEVNVETPGGNYGWDPVPGYDESTPMTDLTKFPNAIRARWTSGNPTIAPSGGTFITGSRWGRWQGALAVGVLKDTGLMLLTVDPAGKVTKTERMPGVEDSYGRLRAPQMGPDGALYVTTSNATGQDKILRIAPTNTPTPYRRGLDVSPRGVSAVSRADGSLTVAVRGTDNRPKYRVRLGSTWTPWSTLNGATISSAPTLVSWGGTRLDVFAVGSSKHSLLHWYYDGKWHLPQDLGGVLNSAPTAVSLSNGTLDVFARGGADFPFHKRFAGHWGGWVKIGGAITSAPGASADRFTGHITVVVRGTGGWMLRSVLTPTGTPPPFLSATGELWSARALGDVPSAGAVPYGADISFDGSAVLTRGAFVDTLPGIFSGAPDLVSLPGNAFAMFGCSPGGTVFFLDGRPGVYTLQSLGGPAA